MDNKTKKTGQDNIVDLSGHPPAALTIQPLAQRSMFWRPAYLEDSPWLEHIPFAFWLIEAHRPRVFVELGVNSGVSYFAFCQAVEKLGLDTRCFAIDTWTDETPGSGDAGVFAKVKAYNDAQYSGFSRLVRSSFDDALPYFTDGTIDLLHIDGLHTYEAVCHDFEAWLPKLSERAVVVLHASNVRERNIGVYKLFEQLQGKYPSFELIHGDGLAVVGVGAERNDLLQSFFKSNQIDSAKRAINEVFSRLGRACADSFAASRQQEVARQLKVRETELAQGKALWEQAAADVVKLNALINTQAETLRSAQSSEQMLSAQMTQLTRDMTRSVGEIAAANTAAMEAQRKYLALHQQAIARESELAALKSSREERTVEMERQQQALHETDQHLAAALLAVQAREKELAELGEQVARQANEQKKLLDQLGQAEAVQQQLEQQMGLLLEEKQALTKSNEERFRELATLTRLLEEREADSQAKGPAAAALQRRVDTLEGELKIKAEDLKTAERKLTEAGAQVGTAQAQRDALVSFGVENEKLKNEQLALVKSLEERCTELTALTRLLEEREVSQQAREQEVASLQQRAQKLESELKTRENQLSEVRTGQAQKDASLARLEAENRKLRSEEQSLSRKLDERFRELATMTMLLKESSQESTAAVRGVELTAGPGAETQGSPSAMLTAPFRDFIDTFTLAKGVKAQMAIIEKSGLFDTKWYCNQYPDIAKTGANPIKHYIRFGAAEGRNPGPNFDTSLYLARHPGLAKEGINPLVHYIQSKSK